MDRKLLPVFLLLIVYEASGMVPSSVRRNQRHTRTQSLSERLVFNESDESSSNTLTESRIDADYSRSTTTLEPRMTFRGRAPSRSTAAVTTATPEPLTSTTQASWYRRRLLDPLRRVGEFFGVKETTTTMRTPTSSARSSDEELEERATAPVGSKNMTIDDVDIRGMIDAPSFAAEGSCPAGTRRSPSGRCRPIF